MARKVILSLLSALLLTIPWLGGGGWSLFVAFVPLFILGESRPRHYWGWVTLTFFVWIMATTWWVGLATLIATVAIPLVGLVFCVVPFMIFHWFRSRAPQITAWSILITLWISFEALYMYNQISFPWLTLGYGFAENPILVQWYSLTGSFGGSAWVLIANVLIYRAWNTRRAVLPWVTSAAWVVVPMIISVIQYTNYQPQGEPTKVAVVQPNIDPYNEKFGGMTATEQRDKILDLAQGAPSDVRFIITPETAFDDELWIGPMLAENALVDTLQRFMSRFPDATMIAGATTFQSYDTPEPPTLSAREFTNGGGYYDVYNSALGVNHGDSAVQLYHKSILVCGVETIPYPQVLGLLRYISIDLGGIAGSLGSQPQRSVIWSGHSTPKPEVRNIPIGVAICYESIYGEYFTEYVRAGAQLMAVITNDGWWGDTPGHRQHLSYARLRAIETRRSIARSANTGISALINQRGDVVQSLGWDEQGLLVGELESSEYLTPYVRYGDWVVRLSWLILALSLLYYVSWSYKKRSLLVE